MLFMAHSVLCTIITTRPVERGGKGESFPGPRDVYGALPSLKNTEKDVPDGFFMTSNMQKNLYSAGAPPRTPLGELMMLPQTSWMARGHFPRSRRTWNEVVIGSHDNGLLGPAVALNGPDYYYY